MGERLKKVKDWIKQKTAALCCHRHLYGGLAGAHGYAAWATGKPEVYVPMVVFYVLLAVEG